MSATENNLKSSLPHLADFFKACADETRLRLLSLLSQAGEVCVCHLVDILATNQPKVSRHLAYLKRVGLVTDRKEGLWVYYRIADSLTQHTSHLLQSLASCCGELPQVQQDLITLHRVRGTQPLVKLTHQLRPATVEVFEPEPVRSGNGEFELGVELL